MLTISTLKHHELSPQDQAHAGKNRFECRTCPYQMILDRRYYERKNMETKGAEDVLGGADSWKNVDKTEGEWFSSATGISHGVVLTLRQPNVPVKVASAVWHTSDRFRFAVPMSLLRAFTNVWSVPQSGVRTDETDYHDKPTTILKKLPTTCVSRDWDGHAFCSAEQFEGSGSLWLLPRHITFQEVFRQAVPLFVAVAGEEIRLVAGRNASPATYNHPVQHTGKSPRHDNGQATQAHVPPTSHAQNHVLCDVHWLEDFVAAAKAGWRTFFALVLVKGYQDVLIAQSIWKENEKDCCRNGENTASHMTTYISCMYLILHHVWLH